MPQKETEEQEENEKNQFKIALTKKTSHNGKDTKPNRTEKHG
jgi:hypothetical protein